MVVGAQQYVTGDSWPAIFHSQIDCWRLRATIDKNGEPRLQAIYDDGDGGHYIKRGNQQRSIRQCTECPPALEWSWHKAAACFASGEDMITPSDEAEARRLLDEYCARCPVVTECAQFAVARINEMTGIWGGQWLADGSSPRRRRLRASALAELSAIVSMDDAA